MALMIDIVVAGCHRRGLQECGIHAHNARLLRFSFPVLFFTNRHVFGSPAKRPDMNGRTDCVADFRKKHDGKVLVGCGTVMDIEDAQRALEAGAEFLVSPILIPEVSDHEIVHDP